jgi:PST family polysaccharide transporter
LIRNFLGENFGLVSAGIWEALWRLSTAYLMVITSTLAVYYLPRLSELKSKEEIKKEVTSIFKIVLPAVIVLGGVVYFLRELIVTLLFSKEFLPIESLIGWQLVGDTLKVASWILGYVLIAKALWKQYVIAEIVFSFSFYFLVLFFRELELMGAVIAHVVNYSLYLIVTFIMLRRERFL